MIGSNKRRNLIVFAIVALTGIGIVLTAPVYALIGNNSTANDGTAANVNGTQQQQQYANIHGSLKISSILDQIISKSGVTLADASNKAAKEANGNTISGKLGVVQGYLVYEMNVLSDDGMHRVIIDAGNGNVLLTSHAFPVDGSHFFGNEAGVKQQYHHSQKKFNYGADQQDEEKKEKEYSSNMTATNQG